MRSKLLYALPTLLSAALLAPQLAHATIPFLGPIIPEAMRTCPASYAGLITVVNNLLQFGITLIIVFVAPLMIAYGGFLYLTSPFNSSQLGKAKGILWHAVIGIILSLSAWLIITAVLAFITPNGDLFGKKWTTLLVSSSLEPCIRLNQGRTSIVVPTSLPSTPSASLPGTGRFSFQSGIDAQVPTQSPQVADLLLCMGAKLSSNVTITSISDSAITSGQKTFEQCAASGCAHKANSCHYGGQKACLGSSYAVDVKGDAGTINTAARACGGAVLNEGDHLHVSVGAQNGCGCDTGVN